MVSRFDELDTEIKALALAIESATSREDWEIVLSLKKEYHNKKIEQLEDAESSGALISTITARELKTDIDSRPNIPRYATGIQALDNKLNGGIEVGTFIQLAGESFAGKTHLVLEILSNIAESKQVLFFNFEMGDTRISHRLSKLLTTNLQWNNFLINSKARKLNDILKEIKSRAKDGIKFFAIDSKMKIEVPNEKDTFKAINEISKQLSKIAQQQEVIIFLINQMNEEDQKTNRMAFKGSGDQMYDTDIALFYMVNKEKNVNPNKWKRTLVCRKNRQDDNLFTLNLHLDNIGRTVSDELLVVHQNSNGRYGGASVTEYKETVSMEVL